MPAELSSTTSYLVPYEKSSKDHNQIAVTGDIVSLGDSHVVPRTCRAKDNFDFLPDFCDFFIGISRDRGSCSHRHWSVQAFHDTTSKALVLIQQEGRVKVLSHDPIRPFAHLAGGLAAACDREDGAVGGDEEEEDVQQDEGDSEGEEPGEGVEVREGGGGHYYLGL